MPAQPYEPAQTRADVLVGVLAEVGDFEVIAQQIIAVEFYQRVEVEQGLDAERGRNYQSQIIGERGGVG